VPYRRVLATSTTGDALAALGKVACDQGLEVFLKGLHREGGGNLLAICSGGPLDEEAWAAALGQRGGSLARAGLEQGWAPVSAPGLSAGGGS